MRNPLGQRFTAGDIAPIPRRYQTMVVVVVDMVELLTQGRGRDTGEMSVMCISTFSTCQLTNKQGSPYYSSIHHNSKDFMQHNQRTTLFSSFMNSSKFSKYIPSSAIFASAREKTRDLRRLRHVHEIQDGGQELKICQTFVFFLYFGATTNIHHARRRCNSCDK